MRIGDETDAVGEVSDHGEHEEEEGETLAGLFAVVFEDLRDSSTVVFVSIYFSTFLTANVVFLTRDNRLR